MHNRNSLTKPDVKFDTLFSDNDAMELSSYQAPKELETMVIENPELYPSIMKYKTESAICKRITEVKQLTTIGTSGKKWRSLKNELWILRGKLFVMKTGNLTITMHLRRRLLSLFEMDINGPMTPKDREELRIDHAKCNALYYFIGMKLKELWSRKKVRRINV